ncbi:restriction endonuclease [Pseudomonas viridiflava]|uniref:restriction endonuclease n=1 Tax=Pseudomonas viridiflava TaxID=33069 RepID=UPI002EBC58D7|nr:restriction endonuclease [Pseudomonas viridiflava]MEE3930206.1 restriction endonuclease [Pseudomonas viridiflava]MEE3940596.1 restriction endonuclease [Pseudomonas viridiflava]MEE3966585.1 restriction endonuclease [Pseudomonas viridiflava]MEE3980563.1 restriction endonuclease [Pseudomonas viridiflava]
MTDLKLRDLLEPPKVVPAGWFQERGRTFERVLKRILSLEDMEPRASMRPGGEEIDGSFVMGDRYFLLEAKWHANAIPASALYAFKGKVDGKLVGTIGTFFSMSDYSAEAVDALLYGKELNLILFGRKDLLLIEDGKLSMRDAMRVKLRYAADYGQPFFPLETHLAERARLEQECSLSELQQEWIILVEGADDARTIEELLQRFDMPVKVEVFPAGGQLSVAPLAQHLRRKGIRNLAAFVTVIPDADKEQEHLDELKANGVELVSLSEPLEDWLGGHVSADYYNATIMLSNRKGKMARRYARNVALAELISATPSFSRLIERLDARTREADQGKK